MYCQDTQLKLKPLDPFVEVSLQSLSLDALVDLQRRRREKNQKIMEITVILPFHLGMDVYVLYEY